MKHFARITGTVVMLGGLALAAGACGGDDDDSGGAADATAAVRQDSISGSASNEAQLAAPKSGAADAGTSGGGDSSPTLPSQSDRKIIFNATLGLEVGDVGAVFNEVSSIAKVAGGYIEKSAFSGGTAAAAKDRSASLTLRVPADGYQETLAKLRAISGAKVKEEGSRSNEITEQYTDLQSRLRNLQSTEVQYLKLLEQAKTIPDILAMTDRLNGIRSQIEQIQGRLNVFDRLTELATIDVSLTPAIPGKTGPQSDGPKGFATAFVDAWEGALEAVRYLLTASGVLAVGVIWVGIPAGLVFLVSRALRRRHPAAPSA